MPFRRSAADVVGFEVAADMRLKLTHMWEVKRRKPVARGFSPFTRGRREWGFRGAKTGWMSVTLRPSLLRLVAAACVQQASE
jgi:hypothetical protein